MKVTLPNGIQIEGTPDEVVLMIPKRAWSPDTTGHGISMTIGTGDEIKEPNDITYHKRKRRTRKDCITCHASYLPSSRKQVHCSQSCASHAWYERKKMNREQEKPIESNQSTIEITGAPSPINIPDYARVRTNDDTIPQDF